MCLALAGCGSGGGGSTTGSLVSADSPEKALVETLDSWKTGGGPTLALQANPQAQVTPASPTASLGTLSFTDLSGESWIFEIFEVTYPSPGKALVKARYSFKQLEQGKLEMAFQMIKIEGAWKLADIVVTTIPVVLASKTGLQGQVKDDVTGAPLNGVLVYLSGTNYSTSTDKTGWYSFDSLPVGTYTVVIVRDGYVIKTIPGVEVK